MNASLESAFNYILKIPPVTTLGIEPQKTTIEDYNAENIYINRKEEIIFYTPIQSDKYRKLNPKFGKYTRNIATVGHNVTIIKLMNMDENNNENNFSLSIEDREVNDWADIEKSPYTLLTQAIGFNIENKNKHYFYVNPNHISTCMRYSHNELYVNWGTFEKKEFLHKSYDQCLQLLLKKTHLNMERVKKLNIEKIATFRPTMLFPIMLLGKGASGCVLLVLKSVGNLITTTMPYALKMQKIPPVDNFSYYNIKYGTEKEVFFYSILEHPNILKMFNCYQFDSDWKLQLLEYVPYGTIGTFADETISYVDENGQERVFNFIEFTENLNPSKSFNKIEFIRYYSAQILIALEYLHVLGIRHFDLKPSNIGIGHRGYVKIFDFGLSCKFAEDYAYQNHTLDHKYIGCKEKRMSMCKPTVIGTATDIFAFGVTLVELFKGFHSKNYIDWTDYDLAREENVIEGNEMNEKNIPITRDIALNWFLKANAASTKVIRCFFVDNINFGLAEIIQTLKKVETKVQEEFKGSAYTTKIIEKLQNIFEMNEDIDAILENSFDFSNINNLLYEINEIFSKLGNNQSSNKTAVQEIKEHLNMIKYMKSLIEIFIGTYHFNDFKKRKTAKELLELDFYKDIINKEKLFKQEYDLEEICNFDLRDLFVFNYKTEYCKTMGYQCNIDDLGRIYHNPELWKKFLLYEF